MRPSPLQNTRIRSRMQRYKVQASATATKLQLPAPTAATVEGRVGGLVEERSEGVCYVSSLYSGGGRRFASNNKCQTSTATVVVDTSSTDETSVILIPALVLRCLELCIFGSRT
eukprot:gene3373-biopygen8954